MTEEQISQATSKFRDDLLSGNLMRMTSTNTGKDYYHELEKEDHEAVLRYVESREFSEINRIK